MNPPRSTKSPSPIMSELASTNGVGAASSLSSAGAQKSATFLWNTSGELSQEDRVDIKQQAVLDGLRLGQKLSCILRNGIDRQNRDAVPQELADWADQLDTAKELYETPHATVGLIGLIGSGKSTLLNAILGERDLLPPSSDRAGTAVACKVVYNHGPDGYRAQILFRSRQSFTDELDKLFKNLSAKRELEKSMKEASDAIEQQSIEEQLEDIETNTSATLGILRNLCRVDECDLTFASGEEFLEAYPLAALGTTEEVSATDRDTFLTETKPFIDSTSGDSENEDMPLWPLIEHVTIFVKSDILQYGLELVDLPGLEDAVESRSAVTKRFSRHLDITAVVTPAIRAMEEKGVMSFIKRQQQIEMRMNGKFDTNSLCFVLSKTEDLDANGYLSSRWVAQKYPDIPGCLDRAKTLQNLSRKPGRGRGGARTAEQEVYTLRESLKQAAVSIRNRVVSERIQKDFRGRLMVTKSPGNYESDVNTVKVFPTSARAFQEIRDPGGVKKTGFPTEKHTGIPQIRQWLFRATLEKREKHLDAVLNQLSGLLIRIQAWNSANGDTTSAPRTALPYLDSIHERHQRLLTAVLKKFGGRLRQINPLGARKAAIAKCMEEYPRKVDRWRYRYPDRPDSFLKLFHAVQTCILRKGGEYHKSQGKYPYEYQWLDDLASVFVDKIMYDWQRTFLVDVPGYADLIGQSLEVVWECYREALDNFCVKHAGLSFRDTVRVHQAVENAEKHLILSARKILAKFRISAQDIHPIFREEIKRFMGPVFDEAHSMTGSGCVAKRENLLEHVAAQHSKRMATEACEQMEAVLEDEIQLHARDLEGLATDAVSKVEKQIKLLLRTSPVSSSSAAVSNRETLEEEIGPHMASWNLCWQKPSSQKDDHVMRGDLSIPDPKLLEVNRGESGV